MSMIVWAIQGIGIKANDVEPHLDINKIIKVARIIGTKETVEKLKAYKKTLQATKQPLDIDDVLSVFEIEYPSPSSAAHIENIADLLLCCEETAAFTWTGNGEGTWYFYYKPSMPWERTDADPKSLSEVHERIIKAVQMVTKLSKDEIEDMIDDDLDEYGFD